ncbi:MAG: PQQ-dependent sugar dehydrogenase, partial [Candidatus Fonsibacter ubiquis]|nr:PQQ-dependent sugar dehydrogenase [Candidatus Fonsibacter ubiquis]
MKKFLNILSFFFILTQSTYAQNFKIEKILDLKDPWSLTFINKDEVLITEKDGEIVFANIKSKEVRKIKHNLNYKVDGQGGLLDIIKHNNDIFICYTEDRGGGKTSTSIAKASFAKDNLNFKNIFQANPPINSGYHFGCRLVIKDNMIYASAGERGNGNIAQNDWLAEIYQIGIRNPQGMTLSPFNGKIYISNHGAKGGDFFGEVKFGENYGWQIWCWGGVNYSGTKCGETDQWDSRFTKPLYNWSPSIAVSAVQIYKGDEFKEWNGHILMTSLKDESIRKLEFINENEVGKEVIIL